MTEFDVEAYVRKLYGLNENWRCITGRVGPRRSSVTFRPAKEMKGYARFTLDSKPIAAWLQSGTDDLIEEEKTRIRKQQADFEQAMAAYEDHVAGAGKKAAVQAGLMEAGT